MTSDTRRVWNKIVVSLSHEEYMALYNASVAEYRHPRDQARWLLRQALGLDQAAAPPQQESLTQ